MATVYSVDFLASDDSAASISITVPMISFPGNAEWKAIDSSQLGTNGGSISSWGSGDAFLSGPNGAKSIVLFGFTDKKNKNDHGNGEKNYDGGSFPMEDFKWTITSKS